MDVLNEGSLRHVKLENDKPKQAYGRPVKLISDLLETISHLKKEKKKWQDLARKRGEALKKIQEASTLCLESNLEPENDANRSLGTDSQ